MHRESKRLNTGWNWAKGIRNLVYTGVTRGKRLVLFVGQKKALGMAVKNNRTEQRFSGLLPRLKGLRQDAH